MLDFRRRSSKIKENFVSDPQLNMIDYGVMMDLQKKSFTEPGESCPHPIQVTQFRNIGLLFNPNLDGG